MCWRTLDPGKFFFEKSPVPEDNFLVGQAASRGNLKCSGIKRNFYLSVNPVFMHALILIFFIADDGDDAPLNTSSHSVLASPLPSSSRPSELNRDDASASSPGGLRMRPPRTSAASSPANHGKRRVSARRWSNIKLRGPTPQKRLDFDK